MPHKGQYELTWDPHPPPRMTKNANGIMVWAIVKRSTNAVYGPGTKLKVHMCAHNPCQAVSSDSKYGFYGPPVHMQGITCIGPTAAPSLPVTAAPVAEPVIVAEQSSTTTAVDAGTPTASAAPLDNAAQKRAAMDRVHNAGLALARDSQTQNLDWLHRIRLVRIAEELQTAGVGGIQQVVLHRAIRTLGQGHLHQGMLICCNPMRKSKKHQRWHRVCAD